MIDLITVFIIALALSMDVLAVSVASGIRIKNIRKRNAFKVALFFGIAHLIMPMLGWFGGSLVKDFVIGYGHWIAFILLAGIGVKMIYESTKLEEWEKKNPLKNGVLLLLAVATSIDAFVVGASISLLSISIIIPAFIIGVTTFTLSFVGVFIGKKIGHLFEKRIELMGGLILILIGLKILLENILF